MLLRLFWFECVWWRCRCTQKTPFIKRFWSPYISLKYWWKISMGVYPPLLFHGIDNIRYPLETTRLGVVKISLSCPCRNIYLFYLRSSLFWLELCFSFRRVWNWLWLWQIRPCKILDVFWTQNILYVYFNNFLFFSNFKLR